MVRRGDYKYIAVNNHPPQLYDLKNDPAENVNAAGQAAYAAAEKGLRARAERDWDAAALRRKVTKSHAEREFLRSLPNYLVSGLWAAPIAEPVITDESAWR